MSVELRVKSWLTHKYSRVSQLLTLNSTLLIHFMQTILIFVLFAAALGYLGWRVYKRFAVKEAGCGKGCGCAADSKTTSRKAASSPVIGL